MVTFAFLECTLSIDAIEDEIHGVPVLAAPMIPVMSMITNREGKIHRRSSSSPRSSERSATSGSL